MPSKIFVPYLKIDNFVGLTYFLIHQAELYCLDQPKELIDHLGRLHTKSEINTTQLNDCIGRIFSISKIPEDIDFVYIRMEEMRLYENLLKEIKDINIIIQLDNKNIETYPSFTLMGNNYIGVNITDVNIESPIVELFPSIFISDKSLSKFSSFFEYMNKIPLIVRNTASSIQDRLLSIYFTEALRLYEEGTSEVVVIDNAMKEKGFSIGPFELMEKMNLQYVYNRIKLLWYQSYFDRKYKPSIYLENLCKANQTKFPISTPLVHDLDIVNALHEYISNRITCMILNESSDILLFNHCVEIDLDNVFKHGLSFPYNHHTWLEKISIDHVIYTIDQLYDRYHEERYRVSAWLRDRTSLY
jgi:3-hydroxybutyryl-CoA dehydrogenase